MNHIVFDGESHGETPFNVAENITQTTLTPYRLVKPLSHAEKKPTRLQCTHHFGVDGC